MDMLFSGNGQINVGSLIYCGFTLLIVFIMVTGRRIQSEAVQKARRSVEMSERSLQLQEETNQLLRELINKIR